MKSEDLFFNGFFGGLAGAVLFLICTLSIEHPIAGIMIIGGIGVGLLIGWKRS